MEDELEPSSEIPPGNDYDALERHEEEHYEYDEQGADLPDDALYDDEEEEEEYDDDFTDEELSSSPSIPDENINFDLVYALHTFVATVDGQATVQKGDNLVLLDDSNSYWWLVRVMASQEVGYIPAENIETPYERLARLNKHRNVEITTATDDDHDQTQVDLASGHLVKSRTGGAINAHSGKPSALSRRETDSAAPRRPQEKKRAVLFGQSEYLEHSGNEASDDEGEYEYEGDHDDAYDEEYEDEPGQVEDDQQGAHQDEYTEQDSKGEPKGPLSSAAETVSATAAGIGATATATAAAAAHGVQRIASGSHASNEEHDMHDTRKQATPDRTKAPLVGLFPSDAMGPGSDMPTAAVGSEVPPAQEERRTRPGSLVGMPGAVPMFNVVRVFAGENVESDATFKTVLLNKTTTSTDLVRQAMQRFDVEDDASDYVIVLRRLDGEEHTLWPHESPLQILESLSELQDEDRGPGGTPGQSRDSVGSLSSLLPDANASRVTYDFSDDRYGKFYLVRKGPYFHRDVEAAPPAPPISDAPGDVSTRSAASAASGTSQDTVLGASSTLRFTLQLAMFPSDLPDGVVFHPQSGLATPNDPQQALPASAKPQIRLLRFARNTTVAEVIEAGLTSFQVVEGVVDGGDDVETRTGRGRVKYGLTSVSATGEQSLHPTSKVLAAYDTLPVFKQVDVNEVKRRSLDQALSLGAQEDLGEADPLFVLRQVRPPVRPGMFSPGLSSQQSTPQLSRRSPALDVPQRQVSGHLDAPSTHVPTVQRNDERGVDLIMQDGSRLRSSRTLDSPRVRYSLLSQGSEQDVSQKLRGVLETITRPGATSPVQSAEAKLTGQESSHNPNDLLGRFAEQLPSMPDTNIAENIDMLLNRIMQSPTQPEPVSTNAVAPPQTLPAAAFAQTRGLNIPNKTAPLQRSGSLRSVSTSDAVPARSAAARSALTKGWTGDRILSDSTAATGTGRMRETYNIHALYSIVDALVIEANAKRNEDFSPSSSAHMREHRRQASTSSNTSSQAQLHRSSHLMAKLLEPTPAEKIATASNGLFALPFPISQYNYRSPTGSVSRHYTPLISQVTSLEAALDELLRTTLARSD